MKCPFGYTDHPVTWRCYVTFAVDWLLDKGVPGARFWFWILDKVDLDKCEIVCANCHKKRTWKRQHES